MMLFGNYVIFKGPAVTRELAIHRAPPRCGGTALVGRVYHEIMLSLALAHANGRDADLTLIPVTHPRRRRRMCTFSHSSSIQRARHAAACTFLTAYSLTQTYPCTRRPRGKTQCVLSEILELDKLKSSHSLSLHGYLIRHCLTLYILIL